MNSVRMIVDPTGAVQWTGHYTAFGTLASSSGTGGDRFTYTGRELDATGQYYYRARYYGAGIGRFTSEDPIGFTAGDANLYRYVGNGSLTATDPTGLAGPAALIPALGALGPVGWGIIGVVGVASAVWLMTPDSSTRNASAAAVQSLCNAGCSAVVTVFESLALLGDGLAASTVTPMTAAEERAAIKRALDAIQQRIRELIAAESEAKRQDGPGCVEVQDEIDRLHQLAVELLRRLQQLPTRWED